VPPSKEVTASENFPDFYNFLLEKKCQNSKLKFKTSKLLVVSTIPQLTWLLASRQSKLSSGPINLAHGKCRVVIRRGMVELQFYNAARYGRVLKKSHACGINTFKTKRRCLTGTARIVTPGEACEGATIRPIKQQLFHSFWKVRMYEYEDEAFLEDLQYENDCYLEDLDHETFEYDGQPSEYEEYQDLYGGDDWDHGQYDF